MNWKKSIVYIFIIITWFSFGQNSDINTTQQSDTLKTKNTAYVIYEYDTLFPIYSNLGPYSPKERASSIMNKLKLLAKNQSFDVDSFNLVNIHDLTIINYSQQMILGISDEEAKMAGYNKKYLAENYKEIMAASLKNHLHDYSLKGWIKKIGFTILLLLGLITLLYFVNKLFKWINVKLIDYEKSIESRPRNLFRYLVPIGPESFYVFLSQILRFLIIVIILFLYLPLLGNFLPWVHNIVERFYNYIADPIKFILNGLLDFLPNLFYIIIIYLVARYVVKIISRLAIEVENDRITLKGFQKDWAKPTVNILRIIIYAFALIFIFPHLPGSESPAFLGISIFLGILLSLGSMSAIANIVAGIVITYMRPFTIGDRVKIGETIGDVIEKSLLVTKVRTLKNEDVTIPNATIINTHLWNFSKNAKDLGIILHTSVAIGYNEPWEKVNSLLIEAAKRTSLLSKKNNPFVLHKGLNDNFVEYELNVYTHQPDKMVQIYSDLHFHMMDVFRDAHVEILSTQYISTRDGNPTTVPPIYKPGKSNPIEKVIDKVSGKKTIEH
jgi:small-conductance mechanosensitive channel